MAGSFQRARSESPLPLLASGLGRVAVNFHHAVTDHNWHGDFLRNVSRIPTQTAQCSNSHQSGAVHGPPDRHCIHLLTGIVDSHLGNGPWLGLGCDCYESGSGG